MGSKVLATLDASRRRMLPTAIGRMPPSFFLRAVRLAEENRIRAKSLMFPLREELTREVRLRIRRFPASAVWLEIRSWRWIGLRPSTPPPLLPVNELNCFSNVLRGCCHRRDVCGNRYDFNI